MGKKRKKRQQQQAERERQRKKYRVEVGDETTRYFNYLGYKESADEEETDNVAVNVRNVYDGKQLIGSAVWSWETWSDGVFIRHLYLHEDYRGQGLLHLLLADLITDDDIDCVDGDFTSYELGEKVKEIIFGYPV